MKQLGRLWRGELPLDSAFWTWAVVGGLLINIATTGLFLVLIMNDQHLPAVIAGYAVPIPYNFVALVGVWRSADRYDGDRRWAELARIVTVVGAILLSLA